MDKIERRLDATLKIVNTGMKLLVKLQKDQIEFKKETRYAINALIAAQERSEARQDRLDARLDKLIASMGRNGNGDGSNGHSKH